MSRIWNVSCKRGNQKRTFRTRIMGAAISFQISKQTLGLWSLFAGLEMKGNSFLLIHFKCELISHFFLPSSFPDHISPHFHRSLPSSTTPLWETMGIVWNLRIWPTPSPRNTENRAHVSCCVSQWVCLNISVFFLFTCSHNMTVNQMASNMHFVGGGFFVCFISMAYGGCF